MVGVAKTPVEKLCDAVSQGRAFDGRTSLAPGQEIYADDIRRLILGLAVGGKSVCRLTPAGISILNTTIHGRIDLDRVATSNRGAVAPLELRNCLLKGGFSGRYGHFSSLSLRESRFEDMSQHSSVPTVDLFDAAIESDLDMRDVHPDGIGRDDEPAPGDGNHLWVRATGARIDGNVTLSFAILRAPEDKAERRMSDPAVDALSLSLAEVSGDVWFVHGRSEGRISGRGMRVQGDVWMSGARLSVLGGHALFLQAARIGGVLMLDGRHEKVKGGGVFRRFVSQGKITLVGAEIGSSVILKDIEIKPTDGICLNMEEACVRGSVEIGALEPDRSELRGVLVLDRLEIKNQLLIKKANIGDSAGNGVRLCSIQATSVHCGGDATLHGCVIGSIDLSDATIGGSLDISALMIRGDRPELILKDSTIGRVLRVSPVKKDTVKSPDAKGETAASEPPRPAFRMRGTVNLDGLSCDTLDDQAGRSWGRRVQIQMNHLVYRQTGWLRGGRKKKPSHRIVGDWILARQADGVWPLSWFADENSLRRKSFFWEPWQLRRNWIYQQYARPDDDLVSPSRHQIREREYRPQPFEQAICVARAEGRENVAIHFEMLKQRIEWGFFNRLVRWWLGFVGIALGTLWLISHQRPVGGGSFNWWLFAGTLFALSVTLLLMVGATRVHSGVRALTRLKPGRWSMFLTWFFFFVPVLLLVMHSEWRDRPFHFMVALAIFLGVRFISVLAHAVMRFGFGYLRRPVLAIITLIIAFLVGWWGVHLASLRNMLVVNAEPVAYLVGRHDGGGVAAGPQAGGTSDHAADPQAPLLMGNQNVETDPRFVHDVSCAPELSEPLYALDVLIPIVDLGEERRCDVRRLPDSSRAIIRPAELPFWRIVESAPDMPLNDNRFWWWMKALYAITGWFIVSLSILTFAQVNRTHAELPTEHK